MVSKREIWVLVHKDHNQQAFWLEKINIEHIDDLCGQTS